MQGSKSGKLQDQKDYTDFDRLKRKKLLIFFCFTQLKFISDLKLIHIPATDVFFRGLRIKYWKKRIIQDPYVFSGNEIKQIASEKRNSGMIAEMKMGKIINYIF